MQSHIHRKAKLKNEENLKNKCTSINQGWGKARKWKWWCLTDWQCFYQSSDLHFLSFLYDPYSLSICFYIFSKKLNKIILNCMKMYEIIITVKLNDWSW